MSRRDAAFGIVPVGSLVGERCDLVSDAWSRLCNVAGATDDSKAPLALLVQHYDATRHPLHVRGWTSRGRLDDLFLASFKSAVVKGDDGVDYVPKAAFFDFYVKLSTEVQTMRQKGEAALDPEAFFCTMVLATWHLDEPWGLSAAAAATAATNVENSNVDDVLRPTDIKAREPIARVATDAMDLVWVAPDGKGLVGFRGVCKPLFPRSIVAPLLRGHFALAVESTQNKVRFLPTRPTNQPPFDFVWRDDESGGRLVGLQGVIASAADLSIVPASVAAHIMTPAQSEAAQVSFLPCGKPTGPVLFKRVSDDYGLDALSEARRTAALKKAVFEGTACGHVYATTWSGKFSDQFPAGPWRQAGLNTSASKSRFELGSWKAPK